VTLTFEVLGHTDVSFTVEVLLGFGRIVVSEIEY
jgi:hypothetical protein